MTATASSATAAPTAVERWNCPWNAGMINRSVMRPRTIVLATVARAYTPAPVTAAAKGSGCVRTYDAMTRTPRTNRVRSSVVDAMQKLRRKGPAGADCTGGPTGDLRDFGCATPAAARGYPIRRGPPANLERP